MERSPFDRKTILQEIHKRLIRNFLDILILQELRDKSLSGYDVISLIHRRFNMLISSGSIYSVLYSLERNGLVRGGWIGRRRVYTLTSRGRMFLEVVTKSRVRVESVILQIFSKNLEKHTMEANMPKISKERGSEMLKDISRYAKF